MNTFGKSSTLPAMAACLSLAAITLTGCGAKHLDGTYVPNGEESYSFDKLTFSPDGVVDTVVVGARGIPGKYKIISNEVQLQIPTYNGNVGLHYLEMRDDGCLAGTSQHGAHGKQGVYATQGIYCKLKR